MFVVHGIQSLIEPLLNRHQDIAGDVRFSLVAPQLSQTCRGAKLEGFGLLLPSNAKLLLETTFRPPHIGRDLAQQLGG